MSDVRVCLGSTVHLITYMSDQPLPVVFIAQSTKWCYKRQRKKKKKFNSKFEGLVLYTQLCRY